MMELRQSQKWQMFHTEFNSAIKVLIALNALLMGSKIAEIDIP